MYREKLMKALLQVEQMYSFVDGMKKELYRNQEALRSMLIAFVMLLAYNAEYGQLVVLTIFSQNFYNALVVVCDNYLEHNENIHVVDTVGQGQVTPGVGVSLYPRDTVPPNSPEIAAVAPADTFSEMDAYESVEDMQISSMEDKVKTYIEEGLAEKDIKQIMNNPKYDMMVEQSQKQLERIMSVNKHDPQNLDVEGFTDINEDHESVNFPTSQKKHISSKKFTIETAKQLLHDELLIEPSNISTPVTTVEN